MLPSITGEIYILGQNGNINKKCHGIPKVHNSRNKIWVGTPS